MGPVREAIDALSRGHSLGTVDMAKVRSRGRRCQLRSGAETIFVASFCNHLYCHLTEQGSRGRFHELFYIPSTPAEGRVGYDLSIGDYRSDFRTRTMHKLLLTKWCDQTWEWSVSSAIDSRGHQSRDYRHLANLLRTYSDNHNVVPFLVVNVCYCLHDYRRMGATYQGYRIPALDSLLRTVIVPLHALPEHIPGWRGIVESADFKLTVRKDAPGRLNGERPQRYLARIAAKDQFEITVEPGNHQLSDCVLTLDELCDRVREGFQLEPLPTT